MHILTASSEGLILACTFIILSGYYGPQIWITPISSLVELPGPLISLSTYTIRDIWVYALLFTFFAAHLPSCVLNVAKARRAKNLPFAPLLLEWIPILIYTSATAAWLSSPYAIVLKENHLMLWCLTQSFVFGRMTTKIILAHLTRQPFPYWTMLMTPLVGGAILSNLPRLGLAGWSPAQELMYLWGYLVFAIIIYFRWAVLVINSICAYLGINCLTIPASRQRELSNGKIK